ncbi:MAG TPA: hypothetical protein VFY83_06005, partial [Anaerolineales bacterium]|nr:hypothetical protein [Anaerolineales bacterium]
MSNLDFRKFYRRRLPHLQIEGATYFVTFRLKNSLPVEILQRLSQEFERIKSLPSDQTQIEERLWFEKFDNYLDRALSGENFLSDSQ